MLKTKIYRTFFIHKILFTLPNTCIRTSSSPTNPQVCWHLCTIVSEEFSCIPFYLLHFLTSFQVLTIVRCCRFNPVLRGIWWHCWFIVDSQWYKIIGRIRRLLARVWFKLLRRTHTGMHEPSSRIHLKSFDTCVNLFCNVLLPRAQVSLIFFSSIWSRFTYMSRHLSVSKSLPPVYSLPYLSLYQFAYRY